MVFFFFLFGSVTIIVIFGLALFYGLVAILLAFVGNNVWCFLFGRHYEGEMRCFVPRAMRRQPWIAAAFMNFMFIVPGKNIFFGRNY